MSKVLVLKVNEKLEGSELKERARKAWKLSPKRLDEVNHVIVLHEYNVIGEYSLGNKLVYYLGGEQKGRVELELLDFNNYNEFTFLGQSIAYATSNPATIKTENELRKLIMKIDSHN